MSTDDRLDAALLEEDIPSSLEKLHGQLNEQALDSNLAGDGKTDALSPTNAEISGLKRDRDDDAAVGDAILEPPDSQRQRTEEDKKSDFQPPLPLGRVINEGQQQPQQQVQETTTNELEPQPGATSVAEASSESGAQPAMAGQNFSGNPSFVVPVLPPMAAFQPPPFMPQPFLVNAAGRGFQQWQPQIPQGQYAMAMPLQPNQAEGVQKNETQGTGEDGQVKGDANQLQQQQQLAASQDQQNPSPTMIALPPGQQFAQQHNLQGEQQSATQLQTDPAQSTTTEQGTIKEEGGTNGSTGRVQQQPPIQGVPQQQILPTNGVMYYPSPMFTTGGMPMQSHGISETNAAAIRSRMMLTPFPTIPPGMMAPPFIINPAGGPIPQNIVQRFDPSSGAATTTGFAGQTVVVPRTNGITLSLSCDEEQLSEYQILVRKQLEIFEATQEDVESNTQGRKKQVTLGQVGIRCRHCSGFPLRQRGRGAVYYPAKLQGVYQAAQNMASTHLCDSCTCIPPHMKQQLKVLRDQRATASGGKRYWGDGARPMGLQECGEGLRLRRRGQAPATS